jgi:micrococcal nuclease
MADPRFIQLLLTVSLMGAGAGSMLAEPGTMPFAGALSSQPDTFLSLTGGDHFSLCHTGGGLNCVVDGDTFYLDGEKIRMADIDAPETHPPRCSSEAELGDAATLRLQSLLNDGPVSLIASEDRDRDKYGRLLRTVERDGESLGGILVNEGLARDYGQGRRPWC